MLGGTPLAPACLACALVCPSCGDIEPCPGVVVGDHVEFELYEASTNAPVSTEAELACSTQWGLTEGTQFTATIVDAVGYEHCQAGLLELSELDGWTWEPGSTDGFHGGGIALVAYPKVTQGDCSGRMRLYLHAGEGGLDCDARGSGNRRCRLQVSISPDNGKEAECPPFCGLDFAVRATRVR